MFHRPFRAGFKLGYSVSGLVMLTGIMVARSSYRFAISSARRMAVFSMQHYARGIWKKTQGRWHSKQEPLWRRPFAANRP
jgi:hypothetical protein